MELEGKKVLVIGGAGFIGSHLVDELLKEPIKEVVIFDNLSRGRTENLSIAIKDKRVRIYQNGGELLHPEIVQDAVSDADCIFNLAALWLLHCWDFPRSAFEVNCGGLLNLLEAIITTQKQQRLVWSSSASVYGDAICEPMTENHPLNNNNFYGATKIAGEQMCRSFYHRHLKTKSEFEYVGLRYMNVYGARQDYKGAYIAVIMKILDRLDKGLPPLIYGDGKQAYDFVNVVDCARANIAAMKAKSTDQYYNVGTGVKTTIKELVQMILNITGIDTDIQYKIGGQTFVKNRIGCTIKSSEELNFNYSIRLKDGLKQLIEWRKLHIEELNQRRDEVGLEV